MVRSLPPLFSMTLLVTVILFVYGMVGWLPFSDDLPEQWGTIGDAMLTLFVMLTLENFPFYMYAGMEVHPWSWVYFVTFILLAAFMILNVLIGIVLNSLEEARELERRKRLGIGVPKRRSRLAPVVERIQMLRAALRELEEEPSCPFAKDPAENPVDEPAGLVGRVALESSTASSTATSGARCRSRAGCRSAGRSARPPSRSAVQSSGRGGDLLVERRRRRDHRLRELARVLVDVALVQRRERLARDVPLVEQHERGGARRGGRPSRGRQRR